MDGNSDMRRHINTGTAANSARKTFLPHEGEGRFTVDLHRKIRLYMGYPGDFME